MPKFGLLSPTAGVREDFPSIFLDKSFAPESENTFIRYGEIHRMRMRLKELLDASNDKVQTPDANPVIKYYRHVTTSGIEYLFGFTKAHAYLWSTSSKAWGTRHTCGSDCTHWSVASYKGKVIATNGVDKVLVWSDTTQATSFAALDGSDGLDLDGGSTYLTAAKYVVIYENYVILGYVTEGGTVYPYRLRWCTLGDETDWDESGSGDTGVLNIKYSDYIMGFSTYGNTFEYLIIFQKNSIDRMWLVEGSVIFNKAPLSSKVGLLAPDSIVKDMAGDLYFLANDFSIRELNKGIVSGPIDKTVKSINPEYAEYACATFIDEYNQLQWSIPYGSGATGNNKVIAYPPDSKKWAAHDLAISAFGDYTRQSVYTIDTWPYSSIDAISQPTIDSVENVVGFPLDICSDYSGYTYNLHAAENDATEEYTGKVILTTDLAEKQALPFYKRVTNMQHIFRREGTGTALIEVKEDNGANWQSQGSVALTSDNGEEILRIEQPCDLRARHFLLKISATNLFRYLGTIFDFELDGDR